MSISSDNYKVRKARRESSWILLITVFIALTYTLIFADGGYLKFRQVQDEFHKLQLENQLLRNQRQIYLDRIKKLRTNPYELERIARDRYDFARPGDIIVNLPD